MAVYSFQKDAGRKIKEMGERGAPQSADTSGNQMSKNQGNNLAASEKFKELISGYGFPVEDLSITVLEGEIMISGKTQDQETKEKLILLLGNIQGITRITENINVERPENECKFHTVEKADSLKNISQKMYADPDKVEFILQANQPFLENAEKIYPGQVLRIPELK